MEESIEERPDYGQHHIWCNWPFVPVAECRYCKGLLKDYPMDGMSGEELMKKYFPDNVRR